MEGPWGLVAESKGGSLGYGCVLAAVVVTSQRKTKFFMVVTTVHLVDRYRFLSENRKVCKRHTKKGCPTGKFVTVELVMTRLAVFRSHFDTAFLTVK